MCVCVNACARVCMHMYVCVNGGSVVWEHECLSSPQAQSEDLRVLLAEAEEEIDRYPFITY